METLKETFIRSYAKYLKAEIDRAGDVTWDKKGLKEAAKLMDPKCLLEIWKKMLEKYGVEYDLCEIEPEQFLMFIIEYGSPLKLLWKEWYDELWAELCQLS